MNFVTKQFLPLYVLWSGSGPGLDLDWTIGPVQKRSSRRPVQVQAKGKKVETVQFTVQGKCPGPDLDRTSATIADASDPAAAAAFAEAQHFIFVYVSFHMACI